MSINLVANGLRIGKGETVVTRGGASGHPSNYLPWMYCSSAKGFSVYDLPTDARGVPDEAELDLILKKTHAKLVVMSHVLYNLGTILPC